MFGCGGSGIEGYVNEPITITANNPEEGQDVDYFWSLAEQPDGSLINSGDLLASDYGQEMVFTPDYPGDYMIEVIISQYGDEISNQTFSFSILDASKKQSSNIKSEEEDEDWLNEEIDDSLQQAMVETEKDTITEKSNQSEEVGLLEGKLLQARSLEEVAERNLEYTAKIDELIANNVKLIDLVNRQTKRNRRDSSNGNQAQPSPRS